MKTEFIKQIIFIELFRLCNNNKQINNNKNKK